MQLRRPTRADKKTVMEMMQEFQDMQSLHDGGFWSPDNFLYEEWLETNRLMEAGLQIPENFVPSIQFVAFDARDRAIGFLNLRLALNASLQKEGGHIGYSVRPSKRGRGFAKKMLAAGLKEARTKNIQTVLLTCKVHNEASRSVILANGGILEDIQGETERYFIR
ncbi:GNAT family N-acetyltransferase [Streptococcus didelphis]|uniref:GNAT family N-acetyltransferase n=1 Tax=Streptococcus didelphis TaxID=102886 RepID=UPI00037F6110|nr:GNAT family N-acetyltransferase [Streptococcus didelphis]